MARGNSPREIDRTQKLIDHGYLLFEKCELKEAEGTFLEALRLATREKDLRLQAEALCGLLRYEGEAQNLENIKKWDQKLERVLAKKHAVTPPMVWYCKGVLARYQDDWKLAQKNFFLYLKETRQQGGEDRDYHTARALLMLALSFQKLGNTERAEQIAGRLLRRFESRKFKSVNGILYLLFGFIEETKGELADAMDWYRKAHASFLSEHNWYHYLYVLYAYARIHRRKMNFKKAYWYLDLVEKATSAPEFAIIRGEIRKEKKRLESDAVDLVIDSKKGVIKTRDGEAISIRKQYVLLDILRALSRAHDSSEEDKTGLSKAEIINQVWQERYRPEAHDNKLYYNINRLRKLIEPDMKRPRYLQNWKEGYRFAPGLKVQFVDIRNEDVSTVGGLKDENRIM